MVPPGPTVLLCALHRVEVRNQQLGGLGRVDDRAEVEVSAHDYILLRERDLHAVAERDEPASDVGLYL